MTLHVGLMAPMQLLKRLAKEGRVMSTESIPDGTFWTPEGPSDGATGWHTSGAAGRTIYLNRRART